mgnify:CR=1 FL=1
MPPRSGSLAPQPAMAQEFSRGRRRAGLSRQRHAQPARRRLRRRCARTASPATSSSVGGLVEQAARARRSRELRAMPSRTQITRHDCVEGWSCDRQVEGRAARRRARQAAADAEAQLVVFRCVDSMDGRRSTAATRYYESIDLDDALPRADASSPTSSTTSRCRSRNGAPLRCRVERQLGYKQAKYVMRDRAGRRASPASAAARAATGRTKATSGTAGSEAAAGLRSAPALRAAAEDRCRARRG